MRKAEDPPELVLENLARTQTLTREQLAAIDLPRIRVELIALTNRELLSVYAMQADPHYRILTALHVETNRSILTSLSKDVNPIVRAIARWRLDPEAPSQHDSAATKTPPPPPVARPLGLNHPRSARALEAAPAAQEPNRAAKSHGTTTQHLTEEQQRVVDHVPDSHLTVSAYAGTGKTSTLVAFSKQWRAKRGLYLAFNSAVSKEARTSFPDSVDVMTMHALAYRRLGIGPIRDRLQKSIQRRHLRDSVMASLGSNLGNAWLRAIAWTLRKYLMSDDRNVEVHHVGSGDTLQERAEVLEVSRSVIAHMMDFGAGDRPFTHDMYLKKLALGELASPPYDYVMVDEAQDLNPVMIGIVRRFGVPLIVVGDQYQSIYAFRGATSAMAEFSGARAHLTRSWRFGEEVARIANRILEANSQPPSAPVRGNPSRTTSVQAGAANDGLILARTNARLFEFLIGVEAPFFIAGGFDTFESEILAAITLSEGHEPDFHSPLPYRSWDDLLEARDDEEPTAVRLVKLIGDYGSEFLKAKLKALRTHAVKTVSNAKLHLSTAHRAKGLESDTVTLLSDFKTIAELTEMRTLGMKSRAPAAASSAYDQETHLLYVATTRSRRNLHLSNALWQEFGPAA